MNYDVAHYLSSAFYSNADTADVVAYFTGCVSASGSTSLKIEALALGGGPAAKYRRRPYKEETISDFIARAAAEKKQDVVIYVSSPDFSRDEAPSFLATLHVTFDGRLAGKTIAERPSSFVIVGARLDQSSVERLRSQLIQPIPGLLRGGIWECRYYEDHGAALEWAWKNYPGPRTKCSLADWKPGFDTEFKEANQTAQTTPGLRPSVSDL